MVEFIFIRTTGVRTKVNRWTTVVPRATV